MDLYEIMNARLYMKVLRTPRDGNGVFSAVVHQLTDLEFHHPVFGEAVKVMRECSVEHLCRYNAKFEQWIRLERPNVQGYIDELGNGSCGGGLAVAAVISDMLGESIRVFDDKQELAAFGGAGAPKEIRLFQNDANHFDCIVELVELSADIEFLDWNSADLRSLTEPYEEDSHANNCGGGQRQNCQESDVMELDVSEGGVETTEGQIDRGDTAEATEPLEEDIYANNNDGIQRQDCQESDIMEMNVSEGGVELPERQIDRVDTVDAAEGRKAGFEQDDAELESCEQQNESMLEMWETEVGAESDYYCVIVNNKHCLRMKRVPGDGSCLYHSLVHQLKRVGIRYTAQGLRKDSADYLEENWYKYENDILSEATSRDSCWPSEDEKHQVIMKHIESLREPRKWAGSEVSAAVADMLDIAIRVFNVRIAPLVFGASADREGRLVDIFFNGEHYDSVVEIFWDRLAAPEWKAKDSEDYSNHEFEKEAILVSQLGFENVKENSAKADGDKESESTLRNQIGAPVQTPKGDRPKRKHDERTDSGSCKISSVGVPGDGVTLQKLAALESRSRRRVGRLQRSKRGKPTQLVEDLQCPSLPEKEVLALAPECDVAGGCGVATAEDETRNSPIQQLNGGTETARMVFKKQLHLLEGTPVFKYAVTPETNKSIYFAIVHQLKKGVCDLNECFQEVNEIEKLVIEYSERNKIAIDKCLERCIITGLQLEGSDLSVLLCVSNVLKVAVDVYDCKGNKTFRFEPGTSDERSGQTLNICVNVSNVEDVRTYHSIVKLINESAFMKTNAIKLFCDDQRQDLPVICSWNVRGCCAQEKRDLINDELKEMNVHLACLQEVNVEAAVISSRDYVWHVSKVQNNRLRGLAFLIRKGIRTAVLKIDDQEDNIMKIELELAVRGEWHVLTIVNMHAPNKGYTRFLGNLGNCLASVKNRNKMICLGDTNAHIGVKDVSPEDKRHFGKFIGNPESNSNGDQLKFFIRRHMLVLRSTMANKSFLTTWTRGASQSQIDHMLTTTNSKIFLKDMKAQWKRAVNTDHKILRASVSIQDRGEVASSGKTSEAGGQSDWNVSLLQNTKFRKSYHKALDEIEIDVMSGSTSQAWENLVDKIKRAASGSISKLHKVPLSPLLRKALADIKMWTFKSRRNPYNSATLGELKKAKQRYGRLIQQREREDQETFFSNSKKYRVSDRIKMTFKYMKGSRRIAGRRIGPNIPLRRWTSAGAQPKDLTPDKVPFTAADEDMPDLNTIEDILNSSKNGKAAGTDGVHMELLKYASPGVLAELKKIMARVWKENDIPAAWRQSLLVPIPKVAKPKDESDFRRISLSSCGYKLYASWLLSKVTATSDPVGSHQAAFIHGRSTLDHVFVTKRVLEETWNAGVNMYVMGLDLSKAFDKVSLRDIANVLERKNVAKELISRIIECVREESHQTLWDGQRTPTERRWMGIKQGCPLSPYLFDLIMEYVLRRTEEDLGSQFVLDQQDRMRFPMVLVYADDVLIMAKKKSQLDVLIPALTKHLQEVNLSLNTSKTKLLLRAPKDPTPTSLKIDGVEYELVKELSYLGATITDRLCRPKTMKSRCNKAIVASKMVIEFAKKNKPTLEIGRLLYDSIIAPTLVYGSQVSVLTKRSRTSLRKYERQIVEELAKYCTDAGEDGGKAILGGKTVTMKARALQMRFWTHLMRQDDASLLKLAAKYRIGFRKRGRPSFTWLDIIQQNMDRFGDLTTEEWEALALNRVESNKKIGDIFTRPESEDSDS